MLVSWVNVQSQRKSFGRAARRDKIECLADVGRSAHGPPCRPSVEQGLIRRSKLTDRERLDRWPSFHQPRNWRLPGTKERTTRSILDLQSLRAVLLSLPDSSPRHSGQERCHLRRARCSAKLKVLASCIHLTATTAAASSSPSTSAAVIESVQRCRPTSPWRRLATISIKSANSTGTVDVAQTDLQARAPGRRTRKGKTQCKP